MISVQAGHDFCDRLAELQPSIAAAGNQPRNGYIPNRVHEPGMRLYATVSKPYCRPTARRNWMDSFFPIRLYAEGPMTSAPG
jgi:hypothetical protein